VAACISLSDPPKAPIAVRQAETITTSSITNSSSNMPSSGCAV